jgi:TatD DNase family protein
LLVDIGANLTDAAFRSDLAAVLARAQAAGITRIVVTGSTLAASVEAIALARARPQLLRATAGVHPHHASSCGGDTAAALRELAASPEVVAVGECGLDFYRDLSPRAAQVDAFEMQLGVAAELGMPVFLHERDAAGAMLEVLRRRRASFPRGVVHCFTGDEAALRAYLDLDLYIGITGWICDERRGTHLRQLAPLIPRDRLMIETDAPYLLPRTMRPRPKSRRNEPAFLVHVLDAVAEAVGRPREELAADTTRNAARFFGW